jgi:myo-inositol 2-dehydrogenase / D-chiro-inositol 1-dehydrogenase
MLKIAVLGTGFIGSVHAKNVARHPGAELAAVYDVNVEFAKRAAATTGTKAAADVAEIFDNPEIQAVVIATPTNTHVEYLRRPAQAGRVIYYEKPIGLDLPGSPKAAEAVRAAGAPVMLGFNRRFDRNHAALREEVKSGTVGNLEIISR